MFGVEEPPAIVLWICLFRSSVTCTILGMDVLLVTVLTVCGYLFSWFKPYWVSVNQLRPCSPYAYVVNSVHFRTILGVDESRVNVIYLCC